MRVAGISCLKWHVPGWIPAFSGFLFFGFILVSSDNTFAAEDELPLVPAQPSAQPATLPEADVLETLDEQRDYVSDKIVIFAKKVDHFFGDPRYFQEHNHSVVQLDLNEAMNESGNSTLVMTGQAKLDLPAAQKRFQLVLESNPEKNTADEIHKDQPGSTSSVNTPTQYSASVRYEKSKPSFWHYSLDTGIKAQFPLDPFVRARGSFEVPFADWRMKVAETPFWFNTIGLGETTQIDFEHVLSEPVLFRATSTVTCLENPQNCDMRQDLSIFHTLNERTALFYQASIIGASNPVTEETAYVLQVRYRYRLHKKWIYFQANPQLNFPRTDDFRLNASLFLNLEILLGKPQ